MVLLGILHTHVVSTDSFKEMKTRKRAKVARKYVQLLTIPACLASTDIFVSAFIGCSCADVQSSTDQLVPDFNLLCALTE